VYETNDDHRHWHLKDVMRYSLWSEDRTAEVAPAQKVGFCLVDTEPIEAPAGSSPVYTEDSEQFCRTDEPAASNVFMGISPGWRDIYSYVLAFQWIDISDVSPGRYWLRADADPDGVVAEANEANAGAFGALVSTVNGHRADPVAAGTIPALGPSPITLQATTFDDVLLGSPGAREFQIVAPPSGGTLDQPAGTWFTGPAVQYTPSPAFSGPDTFTFVARDATSPYPLDPPRAAVTLTVQGATPPDPGVLGISNAPQSVYTSSETQLTATGPGAEQGVTWSVDGTIGGTAAAGTISASGLYRAPPTPPPDGSVDIGALSATGATGKVSIAIQPAPKPRPAPTLKPPPVPKRGISRIKLQLHARTLIAVVSSARTGRVRFAATSRGTRFDGCSMIVRRGGAATCKMRTPATELKNALICRISQTLEAQPPPITVRASLARRGRIVAKRHATLPR
jgi:hypothetical protein